jgi:hypothetical protein
MPESKVSETASGIVINTETTGTNRIPLEELEGLKAAHLGTMNRSRVGDEKEELEDFDGITVSIPTEPMWIVKSIRTDAVIGPLGFLDVIKLLKEGKVLKDDKIAKSSDKRFVKIQQQYEFNVKYSVETRVESGIELKKIFIRRRHPRVAYITTVQVISKFGTQNGSCVNISAGGILMEFSKFEMLVGEIIEIKLMPSIIQKPISCKALVTGKMPKAPPLYALKFEDLKQEDKEAIEFFVQKALDKNM